MAWRERSERLRGLEERLRELKKEVPPQAGEFHQLTGDALEEASSLLGRAILGSVEADGVDRIERDVNHLNALAPGLIKLIRTAQALQERCHRVTADSVHCFEGRVAGKVAARCAELHDIMSRAGANVDRELLLDSEREKLVAVEMRVRLHEDALGRLAEAENLLHDLPPAKTAVFQAALPGLLERFRAAEPDGQWLADLDRHLGPLLEIAAQPPPEPAKLPEALRESRWAVIEIQQWYKVLDEPPREELVDGLQSLESLAAAGRPVEADQLYRDIKDESLRLKESAQKRRKERLQRLSSDYEHFSEVCGRVSRIDDDLRTLRENIADTPSNYQDFLASYNQADNFFDKTAVPRKDALHCHLMSKLNVLEERLQKLFSMELSGTVQMEAQRWRSAIQSARNAAKMVEIFDGLRLSTDVRTAVGELEITADSQLDGYARLRQSLLARCTALRGAAQMAALECRDVSALIARELPHPTGLDMLTGLLRDAETQLKGEEESFVQACLSLAQADFRYCQGLDRLLQQCVGKPVKPFTELEPRGGDPGQSALDRERIAKLRQRLTLRIEEAAAEMRIALDEAMLAIKQVQASQQNLDSGESGSIGSWQSDAAIFAERPPADTLQQVKEMISLVKRYRALLARINSEKEEVVRAEADLQARFRSFTEDEFHLIYPGASERISALLYGVATNSGEWQIAKIQLLSVAKLLKYVERRARRGAAEQLQGAVQGLDRAVHSTSDDALRTRISEVLDEIHAFGHLELPPVEVRQRVVQLAKIVSSRNNYA